jgi:hypothetical protein
MPFMAKRARNVKNQGLTSKEVSHIEVSAISRGQ